MKQQKHNRPGGGHARFPFRLRESYSRAAWGMLLGGLSLTVIGLGVLLWACRSGTLSPALQSIYLRDCIESVAAAWMLTVGGSLMLNYADKRDEK